MIPVTVASQVARQLTQAALAPTPKQYQRLQRTRLLLDVLSTAGPRVEGPQIKYRTYAHQLLILLRPSPHDLLYVVPAQGGYRVAGSVDYRDGREIDRAAQQIVADRRQSASAPVDWQRLRMQVPRLSAADRLILDALAQLHAQRFLQGLSAEVLAARMGVTVAQLAKIERVDTLPSLPTLQRYAEGLGLALALQVAK